MKQNDMDFLQQTELGVITDAMLLARMSGWIDDLHPVNRESRLCGRAFTVQFSEVQDPNQPVFNMFKVLEQCQPGDVVVVSAPQKGAVVGENMVFHARNQGVAGWLIDGEIRDTLVIAESKIPCFSRGSAARIPYNCKITAVQVPVRLGNTVVHPGDYITGDADGVIALRPEMMERVRYQAELVQEVEDGLDRLIRAGADADTIIAMSMRKKTPRP